MESREAQVTSVSTKPTKDGKSTYQVYTFTQRNGNELVNKLVPREDAPLCARALVSHEWVVLEVDKVPVKDDPSKSYLNIKQVKPYTSPAIPGETPASPPATVPQSLPVVPQPQTKPPPVQSKVTDKVVIDKFKDSRNKSVALSYAKDLAVADKIKVDKILIYAEVYRRYMDGELDLSGMDERIAEYALTITKVESKTKAS